MNAQKLVLKKLTSVEINKFKQLSKKRALIPYRDASFTKGTNNASATRVSKTQGSNLPDVIKKGASSSEKDGKNCDPATLSYTISSDKLVPVNPTLSVKLGNVYDIEKFKSGNTSTIPYTFLNEGLIYVGGKSTANREVTRVEMGAKNTDFQMALSDFTRNVNNTFLTQRMSQNFELIYGISEKHLNAKLGAGYSDKLGNEAQLNSSLDLSAEKQNYTAMYKEENYSEELDMLGNILMQPAIPNENLVYVSEVIYGKLGFFEYSSSIDYMKFNLNASASGSYLGASLSATLEVGALSRDTSGKIVTKLFGSTSNSKIPETKSAFIAWANLAPSTNAMVPVGFILKFVNDNATAYFLTSGSEPIEICAPKPAADRKYDVKIQLDHILIEEVHEFIGDWKEDLYGTQSVISAETFANGVRSSKIPNEKVLWTKSQLSAKTSGYEVGESIAVNKSLEIKNLSKAEVESLKILIGGKMYDYEATGSRYYQCLNCNKPQNNPFQISYEFNDETRSIINKLIPNASYKSVTEKGIVLNYREGSSKIKPKYTVFVKTH